MKTEDFLKEINGLLKVLDGVKVDSNKNNKNPHRLIEDIITPILDKNNLEYSSWKICTKEDEEGFFAFEYPLFKLHIDFDRDKRVKFGWKGNIINCYYTSNYGSSTIQGMVVQAKREHYTERFHYTRDRIKEVESELMDLKDSMKTIKEKIDTLK